MHDFTFDEALEIGRDAYDLPTDMVLIGIVPERIDMEDSLSSVVEAQVDALVERVTRGLDRPLPTVPA